MHEVLVNRLGGLSLPRKSVVRLTDRPDMTLDVYHGRKTTMQQQQQLTILDLLGDSAMEQFYCLCYNSRTDDLRFYDLFNSISVISGRCLGDNEKLCEVGLRASKPDRFTSSQSLPYWAGPLYQ